MSRNDGDSSSFIQDTIEERGIPRLTRGIYKNMGNDGLKEFLIFDNCSVYSLVAGSIEFEFDSNRSWSQNFLEEYLPAFYITNCSVGTILEEYLAQEAYLIDSFTIDSIWESIFSLESRRTDGNHYVAVLFTTAGICVAYWMLMLLMYISPRQRKKPLTTQAATILSAVLSTIIFKYKTDACEEGYRNNRLDLVAVHAAAYFQTWYKVIEFICEVLIYIAWFVLVSYIMRSNWQRVSQGIGVVLICIYLGIYLYFLVTFYKIELLLDDEVFLSYQRWIIGVKVIEILLYAWLAIAVMWFTLGRHNPRISYSSSLMYLGIFTWIVIACGVVFSILVTLFCTEWAIKSWLILFPNLVKVGLLTLLWDWIDCVEILERKSEMLGVLGRRISVSDANSFLSSKHRSRTGRGASLLANLKRIFIRKKSKEKASDSDHEGTFNYSTTLHSSLHTRTDTLVPSSSTSQEASKYRVTE